MSPGARTAPTTMQAMDNLKTLAKELNPVVGSSGTDSQPSLRRKRRILMISRVDFCATLPDCIASVTILDRRSMSMVIRTLKNDTSVHVLDVSEERSQRICQPCQSTGSG